MNFDFDSFVSSLHKRHPGLLSLFEIRDLLNLGDEYTRDTPTSTGKRLIINRISFWGLKSGSKEQAYSNKEIYYSQKLDNGVNIWIADNFKGKSSIFKLIKFALTGRNKIKPNIKKWIQQIILNFSINDKAYTIYLDTEKSLKAGLYNGTITELSAINESADDALFTAASEARYEKLIEDFFFKQFSYYSLKWTQKSPSKDKDELLEVGASWVTYFDSIFLESKNSGSLAYGGQTKKIFQMLLGLEFTYPINRLSVERDRLQYEKAKQTSYTDTQFNARKKDSDRLQTRLTEVEQEIANLKINLKTNERPLDASTLYTESDDLLKKIKNNNQLAISIEERLRIAKKELADIENQRAQRYSEVQRIKKEIQKIDKRKSDLEEFIDIGIFFSNLDIKQCPSCDHSITEQKKIAASHSKTCSLCHDPITPDDTIDKEEYASKIENLNVYKANLLKELSRLEAQDDDALYNTKYNEVIKIEQEGANIEDAEPWNNRLKEINEQLEIEQARPKPDRTIFDELIAEKAVLTYRLQQLVSPANESSENFDAKIQILSDAINLLSQERAKLSDKVIKRLSALMLEEVNQLGLTSITEIFITEALDIKYKQDGDFITFDDIAEGEQLRAKIAFYLSLIQLDIENNFGRHTRFLIIDSPAKEEADVKYMEGLSTVLQTIDSRFGNNLQILIGTAERGLTDVVSNQYITPVNEFIF